jgi:hypothetical protein
MLSRLMESKAYLVLLKFLQSINMKKKLKRKEIKCWVEIDPTILDRYWPTLLWGCARPSQLGRAQPTYFIIY